jgi:hypothetical protein
MQRSGDGLLISDAVLSGTQKSACRRSLLRSFQGIEDEENSPPPSTRLLFVYSDCTASHSMTARTLLLLPSFPVRTAKCQHCSAYLSATELLTCLEQKCRFANRCVRRNAVTSASLSAPL